MNTLHVKITHHPDSHCECCGCNSYKELSITCDAVTNRYVQNDHWGGDWNGSDEELYRYILETVLGSTYLIVNYNDTFEHCSHIYMVHWDTDPLRLVLKDGLQYLVVEGKTYVTLTRTARCLRML